MAQQSFGLFTYDPRSPVVTPGTIYDLASVSKAIATTAMAMALFERGDLELDLPVVNVLPEFSGPDAQRERVTVGMLLAHSSGLPAYTALFEKTKSPAGLLGAACQAPLKSTPGTKTEYSDIGFIVLGELLKQIAEEPLDSFCQREVFQPIGMNLTRFNPPPDWKDTIPPTVEDRTFRKRTIQGEVHDENASILGGVAGHAGVFATAQDLARFAHCMLSGGTPVFKAETVRIFTRMEQAPEGTSRALGWDTPSQPSQSGTYFSPNSFGHLGYTGTSLWIDPERRLSVTLLTNRTWPDCGSQKIKQVRPAFHDAVVEALDRK